MNWRQCVLNFVKRIPTGQITTYQKLAQASGKPRAYRAVGNILKHNPCPYNQSQGKKIPCHRVIRSDGFIGGYNQGQQLKIKLLKSEGLTVEGRKILNWRQQLYNFKS